MISVGYTQALRPGVKASFGLAIDTTKLNEASPDGAAHKVGASFTFEG
jgi:voltage-dependent anion channel protein 2